MNWENKFSDPQESDQPKREEALRPDRVRKEIKKLDEAARNRVYLQWLRENVAPFTEAEEKEISQELQEVQRGEVFEDYANLPEPTPELHNEIRWEDRRQKPPAKMSDEEVVEEIKRREEIMRESGTFADLNEALEEAERMPGSDSLSDEDLAVRGERILKKKMAERELERARKEIEELTNPAK